MEALPPGRRERLRVHPAPGPVVLDDVSALDNAGGDAPAVLLIVPAVTLIYIYIYRSVYATHVPCTTSTTTIERTLHIYQSIIIGEEPAPALDIICVGPETSKRSARSTFEAIGRCSTSWELKIKDGVLCLFS